MLPSQTFRANLEQWTDILPRDALLVSLMKGVELGSLKRMSEVIAEVTGAGPERIGVVSGPNLAKEIARREPAASVVACADEENVKRLRALCHSATFRPYSSTDVVGCELGGAYKNVIGTRGRDGRRARLRRQHHRVGDHPRARGDGAARRAASAPTR